MQIQESVTEETKPKKAAKIEKQKEKTKKYEKGSIQEKYPLNPDYLNQIVILGNRNVK